MNGQFINKKQLNIVKQKVKFFSPFIDRWDEIVESYYIEEKSISKVKTYNIIKECREESYKIRYKK